MLQDHYKNVILYNDETIKLIDYEKQVNQLMNLLMDLRLINPVVYGDEEGLIVDFIIQEPKPNGNPSIDKEDNQIMIRFCQTYNGYEICFLDKNIPWVPFSLSVDEISSFVTFQKSGEIQRVLDKYTPLINELKTKLIREVNLTFYPDVDLDIDMEVNIL